MEWLPDELANLKFLQSLWATNNLFIEFPEILTKFRFLGCIDLTDNQIKFVDEQNLDFKNLAKSLATFEMGNNGLVCFPEVIATFKGVVRLNLADNQVQAISVNFAKYLKEQFYEFGFVKNSRSACYEDGVLLFNNKFTDPKLTDLVEAPGLISDVTKVVTSDPELKDWKAIAEGTAGAQESSDDEDLSPEEFLRKRYAK